MSRALVNSIFYISVQKKKKKTPTLIFYINHLLFAGIRKSIQNCRLVRQPVLVYTDKSCDFVRTIWCTVRVTRVQVEIAQIQNQVDLKRQNSTKPNDGNDVWMAVATIIIKITYTIALNISNCTIKLLYGFSGV